VVKFKCEDDGKQCPKAVAGERRWARKRREGEKGRKRVGQITLNFFVNRQNYPCHMGVYNDSIPQGVDYLSPLLKKIGNE